MDLFPLLPKPKTGDWPHQTQIGLHQLSDADYQRNLCENYHEASDYGTPSPLAQAIVFEERLEQYFIEAPTPSDHHKASRFIPMFERWAALMKGLFLGLLEAQPVDFDRLGDLGRIIRHEYREGTLTFLTLGGDTVGFTYPKTGFAPSIRLDPKTWKTLIDEVDKVESDRAASLFASWVHDTYDKVDQGGLLYYRLLYRLAALWHKGKVDPLPGDPRRIFGVGTQLSLPSRGLDPSVQQPVVPVFVGTPILCEESPCFYDRASAQVVEVRTLADLPCPQCGKKQDWLSPYQDAITYSEAKGCFLIYAFAESSLREPHHAKNLEFEADGVLIHAGRVRLKVFGLVLTEDDLKCNRLIFFRNGDALVRPSLPVRGEYYGIVELAGQPIKENTTGAYIVRLKVEGWQHEVTLRYEANEIEIEEVLLLTWPNFELPAWKIHFYLLESPSHLEKAGIRLRMLEPGAAPQLLEARRGMVTQHFEALEIVFTSEDHEVKSQAGIFESSRSVLSQGKADVTLSMDYGTSSSAAFYRVGEGEPQVVRYRDFTETVIGNPFLSDQVLHQASWLPTYRLNDLDTAREYYLRQLDNDVQLPNSPEEIIERLNYFLPSEMILAEPINADHLRRHLEGFRICHVYASQPEGEVKFALKTLGPQGDPEGRFTYEQVISRYLEQFILLTLAVIVREEESTGALKLRVSYPRAFDTDKLGVHLQTFEKVVGRVGELTGLRTNSFHYIDEAQAAANSLQVPEGLTLVMDMGGGTTDIGLFELIPGGLDPVFSESLYYGGNAFLQMISSREEGDLFPRSDQPFDSRLLWLSREIRLRGFETMVSSQYRTNRDSRDVMLDLLKRFYEPIIFFVDRLFGAVSLEKDRDVRKDQVTLYLVGNGWSLADAIEPEQFRGRRGHAPFFTSALRGFGFENLTIAREPAFNSQKRTWPGPKAAVGYGAIIAEERFLHRGISRACEEAVGTDSIAGFDHFWTNGIDGRTKIEWSQRIPHELPSRDHRPVLSEIVLPERWDFLKFDRGEEASALERDCYESGKGIDSRFMVRSVLARFLEKVYLTQLGNARR